MQLLFRDSNLNECHFFKGLLESEGIPCFIKNERACFAIMGYLGPLPELYPELWVLDNEKYQDAKEIVNAYRKQDAAENRSD
ncbi:DUF2007 domain-containing protein [Candidatus Sumerlaeota bacterium]|nr:DUF2007 domain-containing protein [Candidatus Sumerlaeota bacterium]